MALFNVNDDKYRALQSEAVTVNEHVITVFQTYWFKRDKLFKRDDWNIIPEGPLSEISNKRRVDLLINKWINDRWHILCFFKAKKGTADILDI